MDNLIALLPLALVALLFLGAWLWFRRAWRAVQRATKTGTARGGIAPVFDWPRSGSYAGEVVGESHYQDHLRRLVGDHGDEAAELETVAVLVPDSTNAYDDKAVRVEIEGLAVGHLPKDAARVYRKKLKAKGQNNVPASCGALVMGGYIGRNGSRAHYGVKLDLGATG